jgi:DNA-binding transcriptional MerR regulator
MTTAQDIINLIFRVIADNQPDAVVDQRVISTNAVTSRLGITARTVRFYSEIGIATPLRRGTTRLFTPDQVRRLTLARDLRGIGMDVKSVIALLDRLAEPADATTRLPALTELFSEHTRELLWREEQLRNQYYVTTQLAQQMFNKCKPANVPLPSSCD